MTAAVSEIASKERFEFGKNWSHFLSVLDEDRIHTAEKSLAEMLELKSLENKTFLDVGSGSGLFSLAARRLGASVHSFDYDPKSVECTKEMKRRYFGEDPSWTVEQGSVLDSDYLGSLGQFDIVYSWGVLHHTGALWAAMENIVPLVAKGGKIFVAIYNDQGGASRRWALVKRTYNKVPRLLKFLIVLLVGSLFEVRSALARLAQGQNPFPFKDWRIRRRIRGMTVWYDLVDWVGGYPFEVAKPEEVFAFLRRRGFELLVLKTCGGGLGCNEYVFSKRGE